jgi:hypothetical protein
LEALHHAPPVESESQGKKCAGRRAVAIASPSRRGGGVGREGAHYAWEKVRNTR